MATVPTKVKIEAQELGIPILTPEKIRAPEFVELLREVDADFLLVASYGQILSEAVLASTKRGGINLHGSILPKYRGAAPIQRSIEDGETESGVTLMQMDKGMDTGDVITITTTPIDPDETYGELQIRLAEIASNIAVDWAPRIVAGEYEHFAQDAELATVAPKITRAETELNLTEPARKEYNRFRAFSPAPGAMLVTRFGRIKLVRARFNEQNGTPGTIVALKPNIAVACEQGSLELLEIVPEGKRPMDGRSWANGQRLRIGDNLLA
jgi:methionyl-tRNA formyltransferase